MNNKYAVGDKVVYNGVVYTVVDFRIPQKNYEELVYDLAECNGDGEMVDVKEFDIIPYTTDMDTKATRKFKITEITEWDICQSEIAGDCSHTGENFNIELGYAEEKRDELKEEGGAGLPFICEAKDADEALAKYNEKHYCGEYVQAAKADIVELRKFVVSLQVDTRIEVEVYADSAEEAGELAEDADFEMKDLEFIECHVVNAYDPENDTLTDLC